MSTSNTILTGAAIVTMNETRTIIRDGYLVVKDGVIADVGAGMPPEHWGENVEDLKGAVVLPGFVNTHHHLSESVLRGIAPDFPYTISWKRSEAASRLGELIDEEETYSSALLSCAELIRSGVTTTTDSLTVWKGKQKSAGALRAAQESGLRVAHTMAFMDKSPMIPEAYQFSPSGARAEFEKVRERFQHGRVTVGSEIMSLPRATDELILALRKSGEGLHAMHLTYSEEFAKWCLNEFGHTAIEHLDSLGVLDDQLIGAHPIYLQDDEVEIYARSGAGGAFCMVSNMLIGTGIMPMHKLRDAGINIGLGLDYPNHGHNMFETIKMSVLSQKSLELDATLGDAGLGLELATIEGAKALGMADSVGSLEVGKQADLMVIDTSRSHLNPPAGVLTLLVYSGNPDSVSSVMVGGEWLMRDGIIERFDETEVSQLAAQSQRILLDATGFPPNYLHVPDGWQLV